VLSSVSGLSDLAARAVCWNAVIDMVRQAELPVTAFAAMLAAAMRSEPSRPALDALRDQAEWLTARFATPDEATEARTLLDAAAAAIPGRTPDAERRWAALRRLAAIPDATHKEAAWRLLTSDGTGPETVTAVTAEFLTRIDEFISAGAADPGLARIVRDHRDTAERVLRARALKPH